MIPLWALLLCMALAFVAGGIGGWALRARRVTLEVGEKVDRQLDLLRAKRQEVMTVNGRDTWPFDRDGEPPSRIGTVDLDGTLP